MISGAGRHLQKTDSQAGRHLLKGDHLSIKGDLSDQMLLRKIRCREILFGQWPREMNLFGNKGGTASFCVRTPSKNLGAEIIGLKM